MSEMIERVARAFCMVATDISMSEAEWKVAAEQEPEEVENFRRAARAAIAAMREPTDAMIMAVSGGPCLDEWQAMIDEALRD